MRTPIPDNVTPAPRPRGLHRLAGWCAAAGVVAGICTVALWRGRGPSPADAGVGAAPVVSFDDAVGSMRAAEADRAVAAATTRPATAPGVPGAAAPDVTTPGATDFPEARARLAATSFRLRDYMLRLGEYPVGNNAEITAALMGRNAKGIKFVVRGELPMSAADELVDHWSTPYFFHQMAADRMEVRSAGPDRTMWTADDLAQFPK